MKMIYLSLPITKQSSVAHNTSYNERYENLQVTCAGREIGKMSKNIIWVVKKSSKNRCRSFRNTLK